jgi:circadian clock protein KaiC
LEHGTSALISGPAGCGKSTLACQYVSAAAGRGEKAACFIFEESRETFLARSEGLGLSMRSYEDLGLVSIQQIDPAELTPGEFVHAVRRAVEERGGPLVLIDSLNGYLNAMPNERYLITQMHELLTYLAAANALTLLTLAQHGFVGGLESPVDLSFIADTVMLLRYFESQGEVRKGISVAKKRRGNHERTIREFMIGPVGVRVGQPLREFQGVLTGAPQYQGIGRDLFEDKNAQS